MEEPYYCDWPDHENEELSGNDEDGWVCHLCDEECGWHPIKQFESAVRSCFGEGSIGSLWYGGTEGKIGDDPNKMYVAISEDANWSQNKCILRDWFFDYEKFKTLNLHEDCESYGVFVFWQKKTKD